VSKATTDFFQTIASWNQTINGFSRLVNHAPEIRDRKTGKCTLAPQIIQPRTPGKPSMLIRGIAATLRQALLGSEIKSTTTETATANQLPQSGIGRGKYIPQVNPQHNCCYNCPL
jgi:hypothetical protein